MNIEEEITINKSNIRHHFDEKSREYFFSVVDVIEMLGLSSDSRNYWKVLKSRLKKGDNKLVTECNQLKMISSDGKYYLTDVASTSTMLQIIEIISPKKVASFDEYFSKIEIGNDEGIDVSHISKEKLSTVLYEEGEIQVDMFQNDNFLFINAMLAGVQKEEIFISLNSKILTIKMNRVRGDMVRDENFLYNELAYGKFSRSIQLPFEVDIDRAEASEKFGLVSIKLFILDKTRTKIVKVK